MVELVDYCVLIRKTEELDACFGSLKEKRICFEIMIPRKRSNLPKHDVCLDFGYPLRCLIEEETLINGQDGLICTFTT